MGQRLLTLAISTLGESCIPACFSGLLKWTFDLGSLRTRLLLVCRKNKFRQCLLFFTKHPHVIAAVVKGQCHS